MIFEFIDFFLDFDMGVVDWCLVFECDRLVVFVCVGLEVIVWRNVCCDDFVGSVGDVDNEVMEVIDVRCLL